jgi:hypothetical protein
MRLFSLLFLFVAMGSHASTTCISRGDYSEVQRLEKEFTGVGALNFVPDYKTPPEFCWDPRYLQFLQELKAELGTSSEGLPIIRIILVDDPGRLERRYYNEDFDAICHDCPYYPFSYTVGLDAGAKLGVLLREQLRPHHLRLGSVRNAFRSLSSEDFQVRGIGAERLSDTQFLAAIEANAETLLREMQRLPAGQLLKFRLEHSRIRLLPTVTVDSFGAAGELLPMGEIGTTLRQLYLPER